MKWDPDEFVRFAKFPWQAAMIEQAVRPEHRAICMGMLLGCAYLWYSGEFEALNGGKDLSSMYSRIHEFKKEREFNEENLRKLSLCLVIQAMREFYNAINAYENNLDNWRDCLKMALTTLAEADAVSYLYRAYHDSFKENKDFWKIIDASEALVEFSLVYYGVPQIDVGEFPVYQLRFLYNWIYKSGLEGLLVV